MREGDDLILTGEDHIVISHNGSPADRTDPDLILRPLFSPAAPVIHIITFLIQRIVDRIRKRKCRSARSIQLLVVMLLHDLAVKACCRKLRSAFLQNIQKKVDSDRHICRLQNRHLFGCLLKLLHLLPGKAGCADCSRHLMLCAPVKKRIHCRCIGEIDDGVHILFHVLKALINRVFRVLLSAGIHPGNNLCRLIVSGKLRNHASHTAAAAVQ